MYRVVVWWSLYGNRTEKIFAENDDIMQKFFNRCRDRDLYCIIEIEHLSDKNPRQG